MLGRAACSLLLWQYVCSPHPQQRVFQRALGCCHASAENLDLVSAIFGFVLWAQHVAGLDNGPNDSISKVNLSLLFTQVPNASRNQLPFQRSSALYWWGSNQTGSQKGRGLFLLLFAERFGHLHKKVLWGRPTTIPVLVRQCESPHLPSSEESISLFILYLGSDKGSCKTMKSYLSAVQHLHIWPTFCRGLSAFPVIMYQAHPSGCHDKATSPYYTDHPRSIQLSLASKLLDYDNCIYWATMCLGLFWLSPLLGVYYAGWSGIWFICSPSCGWCSQLWFMPCWHLSSH